jgi:hypothetical protein
MPDYFDVVDLKEAEAGKHLQRMGEALIHPRHRPNMSAHYAALLSCPGTIIHHSWHDTFNSELNAFLSTARSIPDVIQNRFGYDKPHLNSWLLALDQQEQDRRKDFQKQFKAKFDPFRQLPLNGERNEAHHGSGVAHWEARVKGRWGTYIGGPTKPIPSTESPPAVPGEDSALAILAANSILPIEPMHTDFWWAIPQPDGSVRSLPLFLECRSFLPAATGLVIHARQLFQNIHNGHPFTLPPW